MSGIPSRTRSLRKPGENGTSRYGRSTADPNEANAPSSDARSIPRNAQSPSRLPTVRPSRPLSMSGRPPSANGNSTLRPRSNISKATSTGGLQRSSSNRVSNTTAPNLSTASTADPMKQDRSRPPLTTSRHLRNPSASSISLSTSTRPNTNSHTRTKSTSTLLPPSKTTTLPAPDAKKPPFATYQQHFSPAKNLAPKPHPSSFLSAPSPSKLPSNIAISAETARLQSELLQLHLLHQNAQRVEKEWRGSARRKLGGRFEEVVERNEKLLGLEVQQNGRVNAHALRGWGGMEEKVQVLDQVVGGVWNLGAAAGGRYAKVVRRFERWLNQYQAILAAREGGGKEEEAFFVEEMNEEWKDDCQVLRRKLEGWRGDLRDLGEVDHRGGSSLCRMVNGVGYLVRGMLAELSVMEAIERDAMVLEREWIKGAIQEDEDGGDIPIAGAVWRSM